METKNKTHGKFWTLLRQTAGYNPAYKEEIKSGVVSHYSNGRTSSLSELYDKYPECYERMIYEMKLESFQSPQSKSKYDPESDIWRKRVIASICNWLDRNSVYFEDTRAKTTYAKGVACRAANCGNFNKISVSRLEEIYNTFLKKNRVNVNIELEEQSLLALNLDRALQQIKHDHNLN